MLAKYMKAVGPALAALAMTVISAVQLGHLEWPAIEVGLVGLASAAVSCFVTNAATGIRMYAKALAPAALTIIGVGIHAAITGGFDPSETRAAAAGLLAALITLVLPNLPAYTPPKPGVQPLV